MKFTIVYDNETTRKDLIPAWGFACVIDFGWKKILFDTGWDGHILLSNMEKLGYMPEDIGVIILSHWHLDHIGGLPTILDKTSDIEVIIPDSFSKHLTKEIGRNHRVRPVKDFVELFPDIWSTGELEGRFQDIMICEQSLILKTSKGSVVITGCSHPDLGEIIGVTSKLGEIYGIIGGFHGFNKIDLLGDIDLIVPTHCTQYKTEINEMYPDQVKSGGVGWTINI